MSDPVEVTNLLPDPKPVEAHAWRPGAGKDISVMSDDGWMRLTNNATGNDRYVYMRIQLAAGAWRFGADLDEPVGTYAVNELRFIRLNPTQEMQRATWDGTPGRLVTPANVLTDASTVELRLMVGPKAGDAVRARRLLVMSDDDYQSMLDSGVAWFDGDSIEPGAS
ncbi:hypothetical protein [Bifidobacterium castoris]|uniref:Uncharacterized protein n=1 Tax=Bifidobacterium castoris TaxID=2306972 RepID=A0A430F5G1_9BIFI|nr:hypothetical protein [Bifidobacterium castoris]RSX46129.1 hypothetical protein D2E22_1701 [Bifidobacterium castoris]